VPATELHHSATLIDMPGVQWSLLQIYGHGTFSGSSSETDDVEARIALQGLKLP
jgi:hypothetical protein